MEVSVDQSSCPRRFVCCSKASNFQASFFARLGSPFLRPDPRCCRDAASRRQATGVRGVADFEPFFGNHDLTIYRPDKGCELAGNRRGDDGWRLAFTDQRSEAPAQSRLGLPGNLAHALRCGCDLWLLVPAHAWRMPITPSRLHQDASRTPVAGFGDAAALDLVPRGAF